jgi:hypothetical protein
MRLIQIQAQVRACEFPLLQRQKSHECYGYIKGSAFSLSSVRLHENSAFASMRRNIGVTIE